MLTRYENAYVVNVLSDDHPGIVAAVGEAVNRLGGNIDSCNQTVLEGYFTLIMVVSLPQSIEPQKLAAHIHGDSEAQSGLQVAIRRFVTAQAVAAAVKPVERFVITAFGPDKPGILLRFSQYLAGKDINIIDLFGDRRGDDFVLMSEVEIPDRWEIGSLQADLEELGREVGFTVKLQHENIFVATNQLRLTRSRSEV